MISTAKWAPRVLAILRIVTALLFLEHATMKFLQFPAPIPGVTYPLPAIMLMAGAIEVIASVLIIIGFQTRIAAFVASGEMAAAYFMAHAPHGFWPALNMGEPAILFCFVFLYLAVQGGGAWALDDFGRSRGSTLAGVQ
jgi:putative oxidoreductase